LLICFKVIDNWHTCISIREKVQILLLFHLTHILSTMHEASMIDVCTVDTIVDVSLCRNCRMCRKKNDSILMFVTIFVVTSCVDSVKSGLDGRCEVSPPATTTTIDCKFLRVPGMNDNKSSRTAFYRFLFINILLST